MQKKVTKSFRWLVCEPYVSSMCTSANVYVHRSLHLPKQHAENPIVNETQCIPGIVMFFWLYRDLLDEAKDYHLMPERRSLLQTFKTRPRCCTDVVGVIYAVGGLTSSGKILMQSWPYLFRYVIIQSGVLPLQVNYLYSQGPYLFR